MNTHSNRTPKQTNSITPAATHAVLTKSCVKEPVVLNLDDIKLDDAIQCRVAISNATVNEYAERMQAGDKFPPLVVYFDGSTYLLADGFHRCYAARKSGWSTFPTDLRSGGRKEAIRHALQANASHGLARSNLDKRRGVTLALREFSGLSDHAIADLCKVSQPFVSNLRRELKTVISSEKRVGRDGKTRRLSKSQSLVSTAKSSNASPPIHVERALPLAEAATTNGQTVIGGARDFIKSEGLTFKLPPRPDLLQAIPFVPKVTIVALLASVYGLAEQYDDGAGKAERLKGIDDLFNTYARLTVIPRPSSQ